jgi:hypothetical protein
MSKLLEVLLTLALVAALLWALYFAFGPQALGVPAMVGVLVVWAGVSIFSNAGIAGFVFVLLGLLVLVLVIGMAMRLGNDRRGGPGPP